MNSDHRLFQGRVSGIAIPIVLFALLCAQLSGCGGGGGGGTEATGTPAVAVPSTLTASFTTSRLSGVAPLSVFFDATATGSPVTTRPFHDIRYAWSFGDTNASWGFGTRPGSSSKNTAYGAVAGHVFETPGTYTVSLTVYDGTNVRTTQTNVVVTHPDTVYAGTKTVCVANGSTPVAGANGCPTGAAVANLSSLDTIANLVNNASGNKRILLKRGDTWDTPSLGTTPTFQYGDTILGAYGTSTTTPPLIRLVNGTAGSSGNPQIPILVYSPSHAINNFTVMDIDFAGAGGYGPIVNINSTPFGNNYTLLRLRGTGTGGITLGGSGINVTDCDLQNLAGGLGYVGIYVQNSSNVAINGNRINDATNVEHNIRTHATKMVISNNYIYGPAAYKQGITVRGTTVPNTFTWNGIWAEDIVIADNEVDAGPNSGELIEFAPTNDVTDERLRDILFERNYVHGTVGTLLISESSQVTIRNNLFAPTYDNTGGTIAILHKNTNAGNPLPTANYIYNNSFYRPSTALAGFIGVAVGVWSGNTVYPTGTIVKNNLAYAPSSSGGRFFYSTGGAGLWTLANNSSDAQMLTSPGFAAPPVSTPATAANWKPASGYAIGTGTSMPVWDDFSTVARSASAMSLGAVEP